MPPPARSVVCFTASFAAVVAAIWLGLAAVDAPDPGSWTGIHPLERKLRELRSFAQAGPVDALVMGSSIADYGFSAELFSRLMSRHLGREYRAYNFAIGGTEPRTLPKLYRLARTVARPRRVFVMAPPERPIGAEIRAPSPDFALAHAPVGEVIGHPWLLEASRLAWSTPVLRSATALREVGIFGRVGLLAESLGADAFAMDAWGDKVSYFVPWAPAALPVLRDRARAAIAPFPEAGPDTPAKLARMLSHYFSPPDAAAIQELRELVRRDGGELHLVAHAPAASLWQGPASDPVFARARADFFHAFAAGLGASFHDAAARVSVPVSALSDNLHLNRYGAEIFTRAVFAAITGGPVPDGIGIAAPDMVLPSPDALAAPALAEQFELLRRPAGEAHALLRIRTVTSLAMTPLPTEGLEIELRAPDGAARIVPAAAMGPGDIVAEVDLPPSARPEALLMRLVRGGVRPPVVLRNPVRDYEWIAGFPRLPLEETRRPSLLQRAAFRAVQFFMGDAAFEALRRRAESGIPAPVSPARAHADSIAVMALPSMSRAGEPLHVALKRQSASTAQVRLQLRAAGRPLDVVPLSTAVPGTEALQRATLPAGL
ncbi:MAG TPA: hypothetical protein VHQ02_00735, partial [Usitatibacter sp.]|nr:hypothetical protein [Usitatibacter sp.]